MRDHLLEKLSSVAALVVKVQPDTTSRQAICLGFGFSCAGIVIDSHIGNAVARLDSLRGRCPMTTVDPDTLDRDPEVLRNIGRRFGAHLALNADVARGGPIGVGDAVRLIYPRAVASADDQIRA
jgi:hypothetical protein